MDLQQVLAQLQQPAQGVGWLITQVFVVVFISLFVDFLQKRLFKRMAPRIEASPQLWDDAIYYASRRPISALIWVMGISFAAQIVGEQTQAPIFKAVAPLRDVGVIAVAAWFLFRLIEGVERNIVRRGRKHGRPVDLTTVDAISKLLRASVVITASLVILQTFGFSISGILAFGGIGGLAVGFAAKDLLANFFGGLMIYLDRPFAVGEWIRSPEKDIEGTVEKIGWRLTCIKTFDKRPLYVPNATFANIAVENPSRMSHRRIYETIGLRYEDVDQLPKIVAAVRRMLEQHPEIDSDETLMVNFNTFGASSLEFFIYALTRTTAWSEYHRVKQDVLFRVAAIIREHGAEIAFPTSTLHIPEGLALHGEQERAEAKIRA